MLSAQTGLSHASIKTLNREVRVFSLSSVTASTVPGLSCLISSSATTLCATHEDNICVTLTDNVNDKQQVLNTCAG